MPTSLLFLLIISQSQYSHAQLSLISSITFQSQYFHDPPFLFLLIISQSLFPCPSFFVLPFYNTSKSIFTCLSLFCLIHSTMIFFILLFSLSFLFLFHSCHFLVLSLSISLFVPVPTTASQLYTSLFVIYAIFLVYLYLIYAWSVFSLFLPLLLLGNCFFPSLCFIYIHVEYSYFQLLDIT